MQARPSLFICGLAKNCEQSLLHNCGGLAQLHKNWDVSGVIIEGQSTDRTNAILKKYCENFFPKVSVEEVNPDASFTRYEKMAYLRNVCLDYAAQSKPEWICVLDMDMFGFIGLDSYFPQNDCETGFGLMPRKYVANWHPGNPIQWNNEKWVYYDLLSVEFLDGTRPHWVGDMEYPDTKNPIQKSSVCSVDAPMRTNSAFGGIAFYRFEKIRELQYEGSDCEHISFNKAAGGVFITDRIKTIYLPN